MENNYNWTLDRECVFKSVKYRIIMLLENDLMLAVKKEDLETGKFPLQTVVLPDLGWKGEVNGD